MAKSDYARTHRAPPRRVFLPGSLTPYTRRKLITEATTHHMDGYHEAMNLTPETCHICGAAASARHRLAKAGIRLDQMGAPIVEDVAP